MVWSAWCGVYRPCCGRQRGTQQAWAWSGTLFQSNGRTAYGRHWCHRRTDRIWCAGADEKGHGGIGRRIFSLCTWKNGCFRRTSGSKEKGPYDVRTVWSLWMGVRCAQYEISAGSCACQRGKPSCTACVFHGRISGLWLSSAFLRRWKSPAVFLVCAAYEIWQPDVWTVQRRHACSFRGRFIWRRSRLGRRAYADAESVSCADRTSDWIRHCMYGYADTSGGL